jgi:uncharacterized membrane protein
MTYTRFLRSFIVAFVLFLLLDAFWHNGVMGDFYATRLVMLNPTLDPMKVGLMPQILFVNLINAVTLTYVVLHHKGEGSQLGNAAFLGGLLGLTVCGSINFLNNAFIPEWDTNLMLIDTGWGTIAGIVAGVAVAAVGAPDKKGVFARFFGKKRK